MKTWIICATGALALTTVLDGAPIGVSPAQEGGLTLPLRLSAFAVSMSNVATGKSAVMDIRITRWSTQAEREALITTAVEKGQDQLLRALQRMPDHGRISIPGWTDRIRTTRGSDGSCITPSTPPARMAASGSASPPTATSECGKPATSPAPWTIHSA